jgi:hypothetical protein
MFLAERICSKASGFSATNEGTSSPTKTLSVLPPDRNRREDLSLHAERRLLEVWLFRCLGQRQRQPPRGFEPHHPHRLPDAERSGRAPIGSSGAQSCVLDPAIRVTQPQEWRPGNCTRHQRTARYGAVTSETVAFSDTPLPDMGTAAAEARGIHNWSPQR